MEDEDSAEAQEDQVTDAGVAVVRTEEAILRRVSEGAAAAPPITIPDSRVTRTTTTRHMTRPGAPRGPEATRTTSAPAGHPSSGRATRTGTWRTGNAPDTRYA